MNDYQKLMTEHHHAPLKAPTIDNPLSCKEALTRVVVGVDPAVTSGGESNETGIIIAGLSFDGIGYVLEDLSGRYTPASWATRVIQAYRSWTADRVVAEVNQGGDLVESMLRAVDKNVSYHGVRATRGKRLRAEPIAALYEQGCVFHLTTFQELEKQMCAFDGSCRAGTDRLDALVWALTDLMIDPTPLKPIEKRQLPRLWHI